jgi:chromate transport protein ChrA
LGRVKKRWGADLSQLSPNFMEKVRGWIVIILAWGYRKCGKLPRVGGIFNQIGWAATMGVIAILKIDIVNNTLANLRRFDCCRNIMNTTKGSKLGKNLG